MNKLEKENYARLAKIGCILCQNAWLWRNSSQMHHIRDLAVKRYAPAFHYAQSIMSEISGVHKLGRKGDFEKYWGFSEEDLLEKIK